MAALIARIGTNPTFIAAMAHCWFAYAIVYTAHRWWVAIPVVLLAAAKEFAFDARYEQPKQTLVDNLTDWAGYSAGAALAVAALTYL